ncbi:potassium channel family protein [Mariniblastus fucicola]|uniref:BK channel n=1 Tax=Mariniblastus fucicola TaxID=980251 RepID=A0A5B9PB25_9BACT|nr:potassium channel family protein [Mariniblastus fucicola]QEG22180.1 Voltage-gated potassium channel Kch [Mariniblastus fucicola]
MGLLILASITLTLVEFWFDYRLQPGSADGGLLDIIFQPVTASKLAMLERCSDVITGIFVVELTLRFLAFGNWRRFLAEHWLDVLATIPLFRIFRTARALRFLRLFRLFRLMGVLSRLSTHYPYILRRGALDFLVICGLLIVSVAFGTIAIMRAERSTRNHPDAAVASATDVDSNGVASSLKPGDATDLIAQPGVAVDYDIAELPSSDGAEFNFENSFWFSVYTLLAGEPIPGTPHSLSGRVITVFLMFMGMTIFAIFAGTVSAFMVDRLRVEGKVVNLDELDDHVVICGWTAKTETIIHEYRATKATKSTPIVVISELESDQLDSHIERLPNVWLMHDDFTKLSALKRAGIERAKSCLVLSDTSGGRSEQDADARTILAALTAEKINPDVYTCAELFNRDYASHLDIGHVNDYVISGEYGAHMLAQASRSRGLMEVLGELLTSRRGNEFHRQAIPDNWIGTSFNEQFATAKMEKDVVLLAVHPAGEANARPIVNPTNHTFTEGDEVVVISRGGVTL